MDGRFEPAMVFYLLLHWAHQADLKYTLQPIYELYSWSYFHGIAAKTLDNSNSPLNIGVSFLQSCSLDLFEDSTFNRLSVVVQLVIVFHFRGAVEFYEAGRLHPLQFDHVLHREELPGVEPDKNQVYSGH